jgi:hypothetical protein
MNLRDLRIFSGITLVADISGSQGYNYRLFGKGDEY